MQLSLLAHPVKVGVHSHMKSKCGGQRPTQTPAGSLPLRALPPCGQHTATPLHTPLGCRPVSCSTHLFSGLPAPESVSHEALPEQSGHGPRLWLGQSWCWSPRDWHRLWGTAQDGWAVEGAGIVAGGCCHPRGTRKGMIRNLALASVNHAVACTSPGTSGGE